MVAVANERVLFAHEKAFADKGGAAGTMRATGARASKSSKCTEADVPLADAVRSYLFNAQLVTPRGGETTLIVPNRGARDGSGVELDRAALAGNGPIRRVEVVDVRQSMANGGVRLVCGYASSPIRRRSIPRFMVDEAKLDRITDIVRRHWAEQIHHSELQQPGADRGMWRLARRSLCSKLSIWDSFCKVNLTIYPFSLVNKWRNSAVGTFECLTVEMRMLHKISRLFTIKTRWEAWLVIYAIALGAVERGRHYLEIYPGWGGWTLAIACTGVVFLAGAKLLDLVRTPAAAVEAGPYPVVSKRRGGLLVVVDPRCRRYRPFQNHGFRAAEIDPAQVTGRPGDLRADVERAIGIAELNRTARSAAGAAAKRLPVLRSGAADRDIAQGPARSVQQGRSSTRRRR